MDQRGKSIKKKSRSAMKMVTAGTMNLSISILTDEIPYSIGTACSFEVVFIYPKYTYSETFAKRPFLLIPLV
jgi:hypothetical protein